jgi:hypothetical protein
MRTPIRLLATASAALLLLSGCMVAPDSTSDTGLGDSTMDVPGADPSTVDGPPDVEPAEGNAAAWCGLVPPSLIDSTLGMKLQQPIPSFSAAEVHCTYSPVENGGLTILVQFRLQQDHDTFAAFREESAIPGEPSVDLPGVGDEAYYVSSDFDAVVTHTVTARHSSVVVIVGAPTPLEDVTALVQAVLAQLA